MTDYMRGYHFTLTHKHTPDVDSLVKSAHIVQDVLTTEYKNIVACYDQQIFDLVKNSRFGGGVFRDALTALVGKPYLSWQIQGNKSRLWRMLVAHIFQSYKSREKRIRISQIARDLGATSITSDLRAALSAENLYPTNAELRNILAGRTSSFAITPVPLDYTVGDANVKMSVDGRNVTAHVQLNGVFYPISFKIPAHLPAAKRITKPILTCTNAGVDVRFSVVLESPQPYGSGVMGVDLGRVKPATAAIIHGGEYGQELTISREAERIASKINRLKTEKTRVRNKHLRHVALGVDRGLYAEYLSIRSKESRLKDTLSRLIARDMVTHATQGGACVIHLERLSWVGSRGGKWDHSRNQEHIIQRAERAGVSVQKTNPKNTSRKHPEYTLAESRLSGRKITARGKSIDRDYAAAINIASKMSLTSPDRTKNHATPKRSKPNRVRRGEVRDTARKNILAAASVPSGTPVPKLEAEEGVRNILICDGGVDVRCLPV